MVLSSLSSHVFWLKRTGCPPPSGIGMSAGKGRSQSDGSLWRFQVSQPEQTFQESFYLSSHSCLIYSWLSFHPPNASKTELPCCLSSSSFFFFLLHRNNAKSFARCPYFMFGRHINRPREATAYAERQGRGMEISFFPSPPCNNLQTLQQLLTSPFFCVCLPIVDVRAHTGTHAHRDILPLCSCNSSELHVPVSL